MHAPAPSEVVPGPGAQQLAIRQPPELRLTRRPIYGYQRAAIGQWPDGRRIGWEIPMLGWGGVGLGLWGAYQGMQNVERGVRNGEA